MIGQSTVSSFFKFKPVKEQVNKKFIVRITLYFYAPELTLMMPLNYHLRHFVLATPVVRCEVT